MTAETKRNLRKQRLARVKILTFLMLILGTITIIQTCNKIMVTSAKLYVLNDNASFYNESPRKTDAMTEEYIKNNRLRQEIYNSEDDVIRIYSNQIRIVKILIICLCIMIYYYVMLVWIRQTQIFIMRRRKRRAEQVRKSQKAS